MKNRILGITMLLAVIVLGLAFMSCPADTEEDREITFTNRLSVDINVITDGTPASLPLAAASSKSDLTKKGTVTKKGADIKLVNITGTASELSSENIFRYIDLDLSGISSTSKDKNGNYLLGSGSIVIKPQELDDNGEGWGSGGNPIGFTKISVITP